MTINLYKKGQKVRCTVTFTVNDVATDPTTVIFKVRDPGGDVTTYTYGTDAQVVRTGTGVFYCDVIANEIGEWNFRFEGSGACTAVEEQAFDVSSVF